MDGRITVTTESGHRYVLDRMTARDYLSLRALRSGGAVTDDDVAEMFAMFEKRVVECDLEDPLAVPFAEALEVVTRWFRDVEEDAVPPATPSS